MEMILKDRRTSYSIVVMLMSGVALLMGHTDTAILNVLVAIWFKLPYPDER